MVKDFENRSTLAEVMGKNKVYCFFTHGIYAPCPCVVKKVQASTAKRAMDFTAYLRERIILLHLDRSRLYIWIYTGRNQ